MGTIVIFVSDKIAKLKTHTHTPTHIKIYAKKKLHTHTPSFFSFKKLETIYTYTNMNYKFAVENCFHLKKKQLAEMHSAKYYGK